ncbi:GTPase Era [Oscillospiraceae bacterium MB08-C2-2]|nr:GTPase Era [Oscillospiraceae bacterium MB08-C2-2]
MNTRSGFVAIVGRPNVGKSSLLNAFIGEKVAIVSPKPQTTRTRITGVLTNGEDQMVFIDTPGLHRPRTKLSEYMVRQIEDSIGDVDGAILVTEPTGPIQQAERDLIENFKAKKIPAILAFNKIDTLAAKEEMMPKIQAFSTLFDFDHIVPVSALRGEGVEVLLGLLSGYLQPGPHYFDDDSYTDQPERVIAGEILREKLLRNLREEIPHGTAVTIEEMKERPNGDVVDIQAIIYCEKDSHKGMIIGKNGEMLKKIASQARQELEHFLACKVNLQCWVKVKEDWRNREGLMRNFGFN